jgi:hypothetical protein
MITEGGLIMDFQPDAVLNMALVGLALLWGVGISWGQEQAGWFQNLSPSWKSRVNGLATLVIPLVAQWLTPYWRPEFGDPETFAYNGLLLLLPLATWIASQIGHRFDPNRKKQ